MEITKQTSAEQLLHIMGHEVYEQSLEAANLALETSNPELAAELMLRGLENSTII